MRSEEVRQSEHADDEVVVSGNKATARVLAILSAFLDAEESLGVSEISRKLNMTKSMVHRGLTSLVRHNYLVRDEGGARYQLGYALAEFGTVSMRPPDIHDLTRPTMERLNQITKASVMLSIPFEDHSVCIDGVFGLGPVARRVPLGLSLPLHIGPGARVILAYLPDDEVERYLSRPLERRNSNTLATPERLRDEIARIRRMGYAEGIGDYAPKAVATGVAFPVLDMNGDPHAAITITGPAAEFTPELRNELIPVIEQQMDELNRMSTLFAADREPIE